MLERLHIRNYRSIVDAIVELRPFTLLVGANGSGKSNLLELLQFLSSVHQAHATQLTKHFNHLGEPWSIEMTENGKTESFREGQGFPKPAALQSVRVFSIDGRGDDATPARRRHRRGAEEASAHALMDSTGGRAGECRLRGRYR